MDKLPALDQLTSEQKDQLILTLFALVQELKQENAQLKGEVELLKTRLSLNSKNSHKPSSTDRFKKKKTLLKSELPSGAQKGHPGFTLKESDQPNQIIRHKINKCPHCSSELNPHHPSSWKKAQVFDIPNLQIEVTEHLVEESVCPHCHNSCSAHLPEGLRFGTQYGPRIQALAVYLRDYHYLSSDRVTEFFQDIFLH